MKPTPSHAIVVGKFMPLHVGHLSLLRFATKFATKTTVVVDCVKGESPPAEERARWVRAEIPDAAVVALSSPTPQSPGEHPDFWRLWADTLHKASGGSADVLIAAMEYGLPLSKALGIGFMPFDVARSSTNITATSIRDDVMTFWDYLAPAAKPHYVKRIAVVGPESSGKSSLCMELARRFKTVHVPEVAEGILKYNGGVLPAQWPELFIRAQCAAEDAIAIGANRVLFCDSSPLTTKIWCQTLQQPVPYSAIGGRKYDLILVCGPDIPWVPATHRGIIGADARPEFMQRMRAEISRGRTPFSFISGEGEGRVECAVAAIRNKLCLNPVS